jgi:hypothetical protein
MLGCHSCSILAWVWFWCFWFILIPLFLCFLLYMSFQETYIETEYVEKWQRLLFVTAGVLSMIYVRCFYYPWLVAKKKDPVLPRYRSTVETETVIQPLIQPDGDFYLHSREPRLI